MIKQIAGEVVQSLKAEPILLFIVILNMIGLVMAYLFVQHILEAQEARFKLITEYCLQGRKSP